MAKSMSLTPDDLMMKSPISASATPQRGATERHVPSAELIPMQFRMEPEFVKAFKIQAATRNMKLNQLLKACFDAFMKESF